MIYFEYIRKIFHLKLERFFFFAIPLLDYKNQLKLNSYLSGEQKESHVTFMFQIYTEKQLNKQTEERKKGRGQPPPSPKSCNYWNLNIAFSTHNNCIHLVS